VDCETYDTDEFMVGLGERGTRHENVPYLDVSATYQNGEIVLAVVNRNKEKAITSDILCQTGEFTGDFEVFEVNGPDIKSENDFGKETVKTVKKIISKERYDNYLYFPPAFFNHVKGENQRMNRSPRLRRKKDQT